jgi:F-type H+-transporting ATPase subunit gamma
MAKTRDIRKRIGSVRNIHKITATMEKVAQSKAMKLTTRFEQAKVFRRDAAVLLPEALGAPLASLEAAQELASCPLGAVREQKRVLLFCVTSSRGLCGGYNAKVIQAARVRMEALRSEGKEPLLAVMGKKGLGFFRYHNQAVAISIPDADENMPFSRLEAAVNEIAARFAAREFDAVEIVSTRFKSRSVQEVRIATLLPFTQEIAAAVVGDLPAVPTEGPVAGEPLYLVEPDHRRVLEGLLPLLVKAELFCVVLEAMLSEQAERSVAMRSASDNADSMTKRLTRTYNRVRQAQITNEMIEIISGSEGGRT